MRLLSNENISLSATLNNKKKNKGCLFLNYVQILRNYETPVATDSDGTPVLSRWETVWKNSNINNNGLSPSFNLSKAKNTCSNLNSLSSLDNHYQAKSKDKSWSLTQKWPPIFGHDFK